MRIVFTGGGTVGHVSPAIAIAEEVLKKDPKSEILFIGREGGEENELIKKKGFKLKTVRSYGLNRSISVSNIKNLSQTIRSIKDAEVLLNSFSPDIVFGTGGYVSYPVIMAASRSGIKTALHESNATVGLATKMLLRRCDLFLIGIDGIDKKILRRPKRYIISGNPIREEFFKTTKQEARRKLGIKDDEILITSFGGSGGAKKLNDVILELMKNHSAQTKEIKHVHACGKRYYNDIKEKYPSLVKGYAGCIVKPYLDDMATFLHASDIAITRCGAMTIAELAASGTPSILIPSPNVTNDHQRKNAKCLADSGAAIIIEENLLTQRTLADAVRKLETDAEKRAELSKKIKKFACKEAKQKIVSEITKII